MTTHDRALLAWKKVLKAIEAAGYYESVQFEDGAIHTVIKMLGGWMELSIQKTDAKMRKRFCELYEAVSSRDDHPEYLAGSHEVHNGSRGFNEYTKPPVKIKCAYLQESEDLNIGHHIDLQESLEVVTV